MSTGRQICPRCLATVFRVRVIGEDRIFELDLDLAPRRGGRFVFWSPDGGRTWVARRRPVSVSPPVSMTAEERERWDGKKAANGRLWHVEHRCRTAQPLGPPP